MLICIYILLYLSIYIIDLLIWKKALAFLFCLLILTIHCSHFLAYNEIELLRVITLITKLQMNKGASCQVNYFSPEQLSPGEMGDWKKKCMFWLCVPQKSWLPAALNPGRKFTVWVHCKKEKGSPPLSCSCLGLHLAISLSLSLRNHYIRLNTKDEKKLDWKTQTKNLITFFNIMRSVVHSTVSSLDVCNKNISIRNLGF